MTSEPELKLCPFCGGAARTHTHETESLFSHAIVPFLSITCRDCEIPIIDSEQHAEAIGAWNRRSSPQPVQPNTTREEAVAVIRTLAEIARQPDTSPNDPEAWIKEQFSGLGIALRAETDPPIPGEPLMSMEAAKNIVRRLFGAPPPAQPSGGAIPGWPEGITRGEIATIMHGTTPSLADTPGSDKGERGEGS